MTGTGCGIVLIGWAGARGRYYDKLMDAHQVVAQDQRNAMAQSIIKQATK